MSICAIWLGSGSLDPVSRHICPSVSTWLLPKLSPGSLLHSTATVFGIQRSKANYLLRLYEKPFTYPAAKWWHAELTILCIYWPTLIPIQMVYQWLWYRREIGKKDQRRRYMCLFSEIRGYKSANKENCNKKTQAPFHLRQILAWPENRIRGFNYSYCFKMQPTSHCATKAPLDKFKKPIMYANRPRMGWVKHR